MPPFIKFAIVWQMRFGHYPQQFAAVYHCRAVIHLALPLHWQANDGQHATRMAKRCQLRQRPLGLVYQALLQKQILAGIPCQAQFRQHQQLCAPFPCLLHGLLYLRGIVLAIRHADLRRGSRRLDPSIPHVYRLSFLLFS